MTEGSRFIDGAVVRQAANAHAVYRLYDDAGNLLYVGVTGNLGRRLDNHAEKRWFLLVSSITLEWFRDRATAEDAEFAAIRDEEPQYNLAGSVLEMERRRVAAKRQQERVRAHLEAKRQPRQVEAEMTISDAVYAGVFGPVHIDAVRKRVQRAHLQHVGWRDKAKLYRLDDLREVVR